MFQIGDVVYDLGAEEPDPMRVLNPKVGKANQVEIPELNKSVFEANPDYSADDNVVETVYETWLNSYVPGWEDWPKLKLNEKLQNYSDEWGVDLQTYVYPESRLTRYRPIQDG